MRKIYPVIYLWTIRHPTHACRSTSLHSHWVSLGSRGAISLARVTRPLLRTCGRPLLRLLTVWTACSVWLTSHFPHWVHGTRWLDTERTGNKQPRREIFTTGTMSVKGPAAVLNCSRAKRCKTYFNEVRKLCFFSPNLFPTAITLIFFTPLCHGFGSQQSYIYLLSNGGQSAQS